MGKQGSARGKKESTRVTERNRSTVAAEAEGVVFLPGGTSRGVVVAVTLAETTVLLADAGQAARLAASVNRVDNPVDAGVAADLRTRVNFGAKAGEGSVHTALWFGSTRMTS